MVCTDATRSLPFSAWDMIGRGARGVKQLAGSLWRLALGGSRPTMASADTEVEQLYACLCPGVAYTPDKAAELAARLRCVADQLEDKSDSPTCNNNNNKRPRKEKDANRGEKRGLRQGGCEQNVQPCADVLHRN